MFTAPFSCSGHLPRTIMNSEDSKQIAVRLQQPPAFQLPTTVNGNIPTAKFIQERREQLDYLVQQLGCLPLQHHIPGIRFWLRIDPSDGGGFGFELDIDTVMGFVKHAARTTGTLVQHRVANNEKFMKWVTERVSALPLEERKYLGFIELQGPTQAAELHPMTRRKSERTAGTSLADGSRAQQEPTQEIVAASMLKRERISFTNPFTPNSSQVGGGEPESVAKKQRTGKEPMAAAGDGQKRRRSMPCTSTGATAADQDEDPEVEIPSLDTVTASQSSTIICKSNSQNIANLKSRAQAGHRRIASVGTSTYGKPFVDTDTATASQHGTPTTRVPARADPKTPGTSSATTRRMSRLAAQESGAREAQANSGASRRSSRSTTLSTIRVAHPGAGFGGFRHITIVFDGRVNTFLEMLADMDGVESANRVPGTTIIQIRINPAEYDEVFQELSRTLGVASISASQEI